MGAYIAGARVRFAIVCLADFDGWVYNYIQFMFQSVSSPGSHFQEKLNLLAILLRILD